MSSAIRYGSELEVALAAVREAASLCRNVQSEITPQVLEKKDRSPVTVADFGSQALVCRAIAEAFGSDPIIAEEDSAELRRPDNARLLDRVLGQVRQIRPVADADQVCGWIDRGGTRATADRFWTLDPIDGTKGFLRREQYAVSLALLVDGRIELGVLGCPNLAADPGPATPAGAIFWAVRGAGAFVQAIDGTASPRPIRVSSKSWTARPSTQSWHGAMRKSTCECRPAPTIARKSGTTPVAHWW
jgi:3'(2'), 5'-bisphosphate nucleotidase